MSTISSSRSDAGGGRQGATIQRVATSILAQRPGDRPMRVGIEGRSAAGKSTFARAVVDALRERGCEVVLAALDDFHPDHYAARSRAGEWPTPEGYLLHGGYDFERFREWVLEPLEPGGSRRCRLRFFDSANDRLYPVEETVVGEDAIVVCEGAFLQVPGLQGAWDYLVWLDVDTETMLQRVVERDVQWLGNAEAVLRRYRSHWIPVHEYYERTFEPMENANCVIDQRDFDAPVIVRMD